MLEIFLCHSRADQPVAETIAARLERSIGLKPWLHACGREPEDLLPVVWDMGLAAAGILLLLSPDSVPQPLSRQAWQSLLEHVEGLQEPPIATVLVRPCPFPALLKRKSFFEWGSGSVEVLRAIERWVMGLYSAQEERSFVPACLPRFRGREQELEQLWAELVDRSGTIAIVNPQPASGKTSLAQQFANLAGEHFRDVVWVECGDRSPAFIAGDLASRMGGQGRRVLLVLDDVRDEPPMLAAPGRLASVVITTRNEHLLLPDHASVMRIDTFQAAASGPPPSGDRLFEAMSVCRSNDLPFQLAREVAGLNAEEAAIACDRLLAEGWLDPLETDRKRFRLPAHSMPRLGPLCRRHAETLRAIFREHRTQPTRCTEILSELEHALDWAMENDWTLATQLAQYAFQFLSAQSRLPEAVVVFERLRDAALQRHDAEVAEQCDWELSWIRNTDGEIRRPITNAEQLGFDYL